MKRLLTVTALVLFATAGLALASSLRPASFKGVVVGKQHGVLLVAGAKGAVRAVHGNARVGSRVVLRGSHVVSVGFTHRATVRGVVVARAHGMTFLSAARHILAIHNGRRLASASGGGVQPGDVALAQVKIDDQGDLEDENMEDVGQANTVTVVATVTGVGTNTITVTVNGQTLTIPVSSTTGITVGSQVTLTVSFPNGQPAATAKDDDNAAGDDNDQGENDQGDDNNDQGDNEDHHGTTTTATTTTSTTSTTTTSDDGDGHDGHDGGGDH
jgi:hypothetical protein